MTPPDPLFDVTNWKNVTTGAALDDLDFILGEGVVREREGKESIYSELVGEECGEEGWWGGWGGGGGSAVVLTDGLCEGSCGVVLRFLQVCVYLYALFICVYSVFVYSYHPNLIRKITKPQLW